MSLVGYKQNAIWFVSNPDWISYGNVISIEGIAVAWGVGETKKKGREVKLFVSSIEDS